MKKKIFAALLAVSVFVSSAVVSFADNETTTEETEVSEEDGITTGSQAKAQEKEVDVDADIQEELLSIIPEQMEKIKISTADEFLEFCSNCTLDTWSVNKMVILENDISLVGKNFTGVPSFGGIFDGQGHSITEANISEGISCVGFFTYVQKSAVIMNLNVTGSVITNGDTTIIGGFCGENSGLISGCGFKGVVKGKDYIGGMTGINQLSGDIRFCTSEGFISGTHFVGGIAGKNDGNIANCRNEALVNTTNTDTEITIDSMEKLNTVLNLVKNGIDQEDDEASADVTVSDIGGIAGVSIGIISRSINNGEIGYNHVGYNIGGIAGRQSGYLYSCANNGRIKGRKDVGGIVGQAEPYITVDFATDIAYQLETSIAQLHDTVTATLNDTKNQSDIITARLAVIQKFTGAAVEDSRYIAGGVVDYANGISGATNEAFSRVDYVLEESSKNGGVIDQLSQAADNTKASGEDFKKAVNDLDIDRYITSEDEKQQYDNARRVINEGTAEYSQLYNDSYLANYNMYIKNHADRANPADLKFYDESGNVVDTSDWGSLQSDVNNAIEAGLGNGCFRKGSWKHVETTVDPESGETTETVTAFPNTTTEDSELLQDAETEAAQEAQQYADNHYTDPVTGEHADYREQMLAQSQVIARVYANHAGEMNDATRKDASNAISDLQAASDHLSSAGSQAKDIFNNVAGRDDISFPQFSDEFRAHTTSLADNMAAMNDNFGLLNTEVNGATGVLVEDLQAVNDQFNNILNLYTDALDGVLEKDYTNVFNDDSLDDAARTTDATIDSCFNFGTCEGDIDVSGIAGTMAIEYDYDKESDVTGLKDSGINASYLTKCVLRDNRNYGDVKSQKNYAGGICGRQDMGTILNCGSYASIQASAGSYVGGVAGSSISYIVQCYAKGELEGDSYVGGVVGDGKHVKDCLTIVSVLDEADWCGAIAGHISENGEVRENFFVSDDLAGIDRVSYSLKAEPVDYDDVLNNRVFKEIEEETEEKEQEHENEENKVIPLATGSDEAVTTEEVYRPLPYEFSSITVTFVIEDEDLEDGFEKIDRLSKKYGEPLTSQDYPGVRNKEGFYADWDIKGVDALKHDITITASYKRYRTTLAEPDQKEGVFQSELLVDGKFKEEDALQVEKTVHVTDEVVSSKLDNYEELKVVIPDDGAAVHQIRFKALNNYAELANVMGGILGGEPVLYQVMDDGTRVPLKKTGTVGGYSTYNIEGNEFMLSLSIKGAKSAAWIIAGIVLVLVLLIIILILVVAGIIKKQGGKLPGFLNKIITRISEKIENKELIFYDDSADSDDSDKSRRENEDDIEEIVDDDEDNDETKE